MVDVSSGSREETSSSSSIELVELEQRGLLYCRGKFRLLWLPHRNGICKVDGTRGGARPRSLNGAGTRGQPIQQSLSAESHCASRLGVD